jgi:putative membrane protein
MKRLGLILVFAGICMYGFSQKSSAPQEGQNMHNSYNQESGVMSAPHWGTEKTQDFVRTAYMHGIMAKELGKMASMRGNSQEVKDFGKNLAEDRSDADMKLEAIAGDLNVNVPEELNKEQQQKLDQLKLESSDQFSKDFVALAIKDCQKDIQSFKEASNMVQNDGLSTWIKNTIPVLEKNLSAAQGIQKKLSGNDGMMQ